MRKRTNTFESRRKTRQKLSSTDEPHRDCPRGRKASQSTTRETAEAVSAAREEPTCEEKGPEAVGSSGPADEAIATPGLDVDTATVPERHEISKPIRFHVMLKCPYCKEPLDPDGSCKPCAAQFVGIADEDGARMDFTLPEPSDEASPPAYRRFWDVDAEGRAIICFKSASTGRSVWIPCFVDYVDRERGAGTRFPFWIPEPRIGGAVVQILADFTDDQMNERAAHLPGRTGDHARIYDTDTFLREYYWRHMDRPGRQSRTERKAIVTSRHRRANCSPGCKKRHRRND